MCEYVCVSVCVRVHVCVRVCACVCVCLIVCANTREIRKSHDLHLWPSTLEDA